MRKEKLKRCPFCGGKAKLEEITSLEPWIECKQCGVRVMVKTIYRAFKDTEENAIKQWNTRYGE